MRTVLLGVTLGAVGGLAMLGCGRGLPASGLRPDQSRAIDRLLESQRSAHHILGMAVAVLEHGTVATRVILGLADVESGVPVSANTPFQLSSTTKSFTAASVLLLVGDGRLRLSDRVGDLLAGLPPAWHPVTVRQLLSHTSGLPDVTRESGHLDLIADSWERALPMLEAAPLQFAPGERWAYTQTNYVLLAQIVERISGLTLEEFMAERLFRPLGMVDTFFAAPGDATRSCATNYELSDGGETVRRDLEFPPFVHAAGGLCASLEDLIRWNVALDSGRVLSSELAQQMWSATPLDDGSTFRLDGRTIGYGLGWVVDDSSRASVGRSLGRQFDRLSQVPRRRLHGDRAPQRRPGPGRSHRVPRVDRAGGTRVGRIDGADETLGRRHRG